MAKNTITGEQKAIAGLLGLVLLMGGFGGGWLLTQDEYDHAYVCPLTQEVGVFHRLSSTAKTGYYLDASGQEVASSCRQGRNYEEWQSLKDYAEKMGIDPHSLLVNFDKATPDSLTGVPNPSKGSKAWICYTDGTCYDK